MKLMMYFFSIYSFSLRCMLKKLYIFLILALSFVVTGAVYASYSGLLLPIGGGGNVGSYQDWYGPGYKAVDEKGDCNGEVDFNASTSTSAPYNQELYRVDISGIPNGSIINAILIHPCLGLYYPNTSSTIDVFYRYNNLTSGYLGSYSPASTTFSSDFGTSTWSGLSLLKTSSTILQIGVRYTSGNGGAKLSQLRAGVLY